MPPAPSRRARLREQTLAEIKEHALAQVAEAGAEALSLNAIGRAMGMSGPALYRYFASRDALLAALVADAYDDLADALEQAAAGARRRAPAAPPRRPRGARGAAATPSRSASIRRSARASKATIPRASRGSSRAARSPR